MKTEKTRYLKVSQVAEKLNCDERTIRNLMAEKALGYVKIGPKIIRIREDQLGKYLNNQTVNSHADRA